MKKIVALCLSLYVMLSLIPAVSLASSQETTTELTIWIQFQGRYGNVISNPGENDVWKTLQEKTNTKLNFIQSPIEGATEAFNLMLASGDLPDIIYIEYPWQVGFHDVGDRAVEDGIAIYLDEYMEYAPNYAKTIKENELMEKEVKSDTGKIWAFCQLENPTQVPWAGLSVRQDWLDELNLEQPKTMAEMHDMLVAFKEKKGATAPLAFSMNTFYSGVTDIISGFNTTVDYYQVNGQVKFGPAEPGYKDFVTTMKQWYDEGLLDAEFATYANEWDEGLLKKAYNNQVGVLITGGYQFQSFNRNTDDEKARWLGMATPVFNEGDSIHLRLNPAYVRDARTWITPACENIPAAMKLIDYMYSEEGYLLANYGLEGRGLKYVDGVPQLNFEILDTMNLTDAQKMLSPYDLMGQFIWYEGPFKRTYLREASAWNEDEHGSMILWGSQGNDWNMPPVQMNTIESDEFNSVNADIRTYVDEMTAKFITGIAPMEEYDNFVETLKKMGLDQAIAAKQAALDRFNAR